MPTGGLVLHTSTAINYIMFAIDSGLMKQFVWEKERALMESDFNINLAVSESSLKAWPRDRYTSSWVGRLDNINCSHRAMTVDGQSTALVSGNTKVRLFRPNFRKYVFFGCNGTFGDISINQYREAKCSRSKAALTDESFVSELHYAAQCMNQRAKNGVRLGREDDVTDALINSIVSESGMGESVLLIVLSPKGCLLTVK